VISPITLTSRGRDAWAAAVARSLFAAFAQDEADQYCRTIDIESLCFFLMDNRTFRSEDFGPSMHRPPVPVNSAGQ
jgi:hypothetical protein